MGHDGDRRGVGGRTGSGRRGRGAAGRPGGDRRAVSGERGRGGRADREGGPPRPDLGDERPRLPRDVYRDLRSAAREGSIEDVAAAYGQAGVALDEGRPADAERLLRWAKSQASRSPVIREGLGVALYLQEKYDEARAELQTYRRLSGSADQNHLLADCVRAQGRADKVEEYVAEMLAAQVDARRVAEGVMVLAGSRADRGDVDGALAALARAPLADIEVDLTHVRVWYLAAGLHGRRGEHDRERELLQQVAAAQPDYLDVQERLTTSEADPPAAG